MSTLAARRTDWRGTAWLAVMAAAVAGLALAAAWCLERGIGWPCLFLNLTGVPCPTCGMTRCLAALASLDFMAALRFNPLICLLAAGSLALPFAWGRAGRLPVWWWRVAAAVAALNWIYLWLFLPR